MVYRFLIWLFSTPQEADAIIGDLHEERAGGRQYARAIFELAVAPFRHAPWKTAGLAILFLALTFPMTWITNKGAQEFVLRVPVYHYIPATLFWQLVTAKPQLLIGMLIAFTARRHAMSTALAVVCGILVMVAVIDPLLLTFVAGNRRDFLFWLSRAFYAVTFWGGAVVLGTIVGLILRRFSGAMARRAPRVTS